MTPWAIELNKRQAKGLCRSCGKPRGRNGNNCLCGACREKQRDRAAERYHVKKKAGKCVSYNCTHAASPGHVRCPVHLAYHSGYTARTRAKKRPNNSTIAKREGE